MRMGEERADGTREPETESRDDPSWFPAIAGMLGFIVGGGLGWVLGLRNGPDNALQLGLVGGFIGMVLAVVPATKRQTDQEHDQTSPQPEHEDRGLLTMITSLRRAKAPSAVRTPGGGLETRPVPNRNADPTGHIEGGLVVRIIRRSGIWARIEVGEESQVPIWVKHRRLEPIENPSETSEPS